VFIACLGLFALASFTAELRTKEIGIRKVLGASVNGVILLLSNEFVKLVLIANVIAWPTAYLVMQRWLQTFAYQVQIGPGIFLLSGILALLITLLTVSYHAVRTALINPVDALRTE
jgi:putative ABC transport system permease protein